MSENLFIAVEVDEPVRSDPGMVAKLAEVCPVDIYASGDGGKLRIVTENLDECVLCQLCINAAPAGTVRVVKLYDNGALLGA
jgi:NAD-dependent dihydropyrimidine dehydrogenase PreA subunit